MGNWCNSGVVGLPNVGKSSLINSLKRARVAQTGNTPGVTKTVQQVRFHEPPSLFLLATTPICCPLKQQSRRNLLSDFDEEVYVREQIHLDKTVTLLDSPGIVFSHAGGDAVAALRNCLKVCAPQPIASPP